LDDEVVKYAIIVDDDMRAWNGQYVEQVLQIPIMNCKHDDVTLLKVAQVLESLHALFWAKITSMEELATADSPCKLIPQAKTRVL
jgi:hypothetical protein